MSSPEIRQDKVASLQQAISSGNYKLDPAGYRRVDDRRARLSFTRFSTMAVAQARTLRDDSDSS